MSNDYVVSHGDTLSSIARRMGCTPQELQSANHITDPKRLRIGMHLTLPRARQQANTTRPVDHTLAPSVPTSAAPIASGPSLSERWHHLTDEVTGTGEAAVAKTVSLWHAVSDPVVQWLREVESRQAVHAKDNTTAKKREPEQQARAKTAKTARSAPGKRHRDEVLNKLHERLCAVPHVVSTGGVALTRNERKMLVAAVGLCEANNDVFGAENTDQEFKGRKFGRRGIETGYSRIVHIGLSYGYIQCIQDGGTLGQLLVKMRQRESRLFDQYFPNAAQLIQMTTTGLPGATKYGLSGQAYWSKLKADQKKDLQKRANTDADDDNEADNPLSESEQIRGARVQKIPYVEGYPAIDLWEDYDDPPIIDGRPADFRGYLSAFQAAGEVPVFQDVQLDFAVDNYVDPILGKCKDWKIRTSSGLAFVVACAIRWGPVSKTTRLLLDVASALAEKPVTAFNSADEERKCVKALADRFDPKSKVSKLMIGSGSTAVTFDRDEARRAKVLLADEFHFLSEDLYDLSTYDAAHDY